MKSVLNKKQEYHIQFNKEKDGCWYVDFLHWPFSHDNLAMGWHCITVWECELKPAKREETLDSIAFTLNHIWLQDHGAKTIPYPKLDEEDIQMPLAAEDRV